MSPAENPPRPPGRGFLVFGAALLVISAVVIWRLDALPYQDGEIRYQSLHALLTEGRLAEVRYSLYGPVTATPLWYLGRADGDEKGRAFALNRVLLLGCLPVVWWVFRGLLSARELVAFSLALAVASMLPHYTMSFMGEVFTALGVGVGLAAVATGRWWGWPVAVLATANTPATVPALGLSALVVCWDRRRLRYLLAPAAAAALVLAENYARRGDPFHAGYERDRNLYPNALPYSGLEGFSYPLGFGLLSVLFSFGKGLLFYAPGSFAPLPDGPPGDAAGEKVRLVHRVWMAYLVGLVLVYARWWCWSGSWCWGPRFMLFAAFPAALALARWGSRPPAHPAGLALLAAAALLSGWVGAAGMVFHDYGIQKFSTDHGYLDFAAFYVPECSALCWPYSYPEMVKPPSAAEWVRLGVGLAAGCYLAAPFLPPLAAWAARRGRGAVGAVWAGPRFRF